MGPTAPRQSPVGGKSPRVNNCATLKLSRMESGGGVMGQEAAVLVGGPADGLRLKVAGRPWVLQVSFPCQTEAPRGGVRVEAVYVYRRDPRVKSEPLRYGFDVASP